MEHFWGGVRLHCHLRKNSERLKEGRGSVEGGVRRFRKKSEVEKVVSANTSQVNERPREQLEKSTKAAWMKMKTESGRVGVSF